MFVLFYASFSMHSILYISFTFTSRAEDDQQGEQVQEGAQAVDQRQGRAGVKTD